MSKTADSVDIKVIKLENQNGAGNNTLYLGGVITNGFKDLGVVELTMTTPLIK